MAAEAIGGEDSRVKKKWGEENYKVYTRRKHNKAKTPAGVVPTQSSQQTLTTATTTDENNKSSPPQKVPEVVPSDDSSSRNRLELAADNATAKVNGTPGYVKLDDLVKINFKSIEKGEARDVKRMLVSELDQVSTLVKKLEAKIADLSSEYNNSQFSANEIVDRGISLMRVNSDVGSVAIAHSQPFPGSSISVVNNSYSHAGHGVGIYGNNGEFAEKEKRTRKANQLYKNSEFLLAKDKLTLAESNKKLKPNVGRTNGGKPGGGFGVERFSSQVLKACINLLSKLMKHPYGWVFNSPVDVKALGLHDYYIIIKHPMDLGTVKTRLSKNWYKSPREFAEDVRLTFNNAMLYNPKGQDVHAMAETLSKIFEEKWAAIESDYIFNWRYDMMGHNSSLPTHFSRKSIISTPAVVSAPLTPSAPAITPLETRTYERSESMTTPVNPKPRMMHLAPPGRTPAPKKPKAKDPHKRDMTFEEKQKLSVNLQKLPPEKLDSIVQIINKRNPAIFQQEEEIEVDIDNVDTETLWELDRFVTNYKKSLSKNKRKAELALQASKGLHQSVGEKNIPGVGELKAAEKVVETGASPIQGEKQVNEISGSSSSSSSSSDSGSSSSDSDSDSSSA